MKKSSSADPVYIPPPTISDAEVEARRVKALRDAQARRGRRASILTSGLGDGTDSNTIRKTLLGD